MTRMRAKLYNSFEQRIRGRILYIIRLQCDYSTYIKRYGYQQLAAQLLVATQLSCAGVDLFMALNWIVSAFSLVYDHRNSPWGQGNPSSYHYWG